MAYSPHTWNEKEPITKIKMQHIEDGIAALDSQQSINTENIDTLENQVNALYPIIAADFSLESGAYSTTDGTKSNNTTRIRNAVLYPTSMITSIKMPEGYSFRYTAYNNEQQYIGYSADWITSLDISTLSLNINFIGLIIRNTESPSSNIQNEISTVQSGMIIKSITRLAQDYASIQNNMLALTHIDLNILGKYLGPEGNEISNSNYNCSDFIPCVADSVLTLKGFWTGAAADSALAYAFYDEYEVFISGQNGITTDTTVVTIPNDTAYVRFSSRISNGETPIAYVSNHTVQDVRNLQKQINTLSNETQVLTDDLAKNFDIDTNYFKGDYVWYNNSRYKFIDDHAAGVWTNADVELISLGEDVTNISNSISNYYNIVTTENDWFQGRFITQSGEYYSNDSTKIVNKSNSITDSVLKAVAATGYAFYVYGWSDNTYLGCWTGSGFTTTSATGYSVSEQDFRPIRVAGATKIRLMLRKTDNTDLTPANAGDKVTYYYKESVISVLTSQVSEVDGKINLLNPANWLTFESGNVNTNKKLYDDNVSYDGRSRTTTYLQNVKKIKIYSNTTTAKTAYIFCYDEKGQYLRNTAVSFSSSGGTTEPASDVKFIRIVVAIPIENVESYGLHFVIESNVAATADDIVYNYARLNALEPANWIELESGSLSQNGRIYGDTVTDANRSRSKTCLQNITRLFVSSNSSTSKNIYVNCYDETGHFLRQKAAAFTSKGTNVRPESDVKYIRFFVNMPLADTVTMDVRFKVESDTAKTSNDIIAAKMDYLSDQHGPLPEYYDENVENGIIRYLKKKSGVIGDSFCFLTDVHTYANSMHSGQILERIGKKTDCRKVFCAGDLTPAYQADASVDKLKGYASSWLESMRLFKETMKYYGMHGNHDMYMSNSSESGATIYRLPYSSSYAVICGANGDDAVSPSQGAMYYYVDNKKERIRYICLDTSDYSDTKADSYEIMRVTSAQLSWLSNVLLATEAGWSIVVMGHIPCATALYGFPAGYQSAVDALTALGNLLKDFKNKRSGTYGDFTNAGAELVAYICGHAHCDQWVKEDGLLAICVTCDSRGQHIRENITDLHGVNWTRDRNTVSEQAIDIFTIDTLNKKLYATRFGVGGYGDTTNNIATTSDIYDREWDWSIST